MTYKQKQLFTFILGNAILALGICLNAKSQMGLGAIMTIPYGVTALTGITIGITSFTFYAIMVLMQLILLKSDFSISQWLQLVASFLSSLMLQIFDGLILFPQGTFARVTFLLLGITLTAIGASLTVVSGLIPGAPDGLADVIGKVLKRDFGTGKSILDMCCLALALLLGFVTGTGLVAVGIGVGTLIAVLLTGRIVTYFHPVALKVFNSK